MAQKLVERTKRIVLQPFAYTVFVVVSNDVHRSTAKRHLKVDNNWSALHAGATNALFSYLFLPANATAGTIAHEAFHCVWHIMKMLGADFENEIMAYTVSYLVNTISDFAQGRKPRPAKRTTFTSSRNSNALSF